MWSEKEHKYLDNVFATPDNVPDECKEIVTQTVEKMKNTVKSRRKNQPWCLDDFEIGMKLGSGKFGRVYLARDIHCHLPFALKLMHKSEIIKNRAERQILREIEIQSHLNHPNILRLYTYFDDHRFIYLVLEYASEGELYKHLRNAPNGRFPDKVATKYMYQVVAALRYCHERKVIHRDIKPENILLSYEDTIKLSDFGWSVHAPSSSRRTMCGTLDYLPPEMVAHTSYDPNVDNWCLGILCYEFVTGKAPFETGSTEATYNRIKSLDYSFPNYVSHGARHLIQSLLQLDPAKRLSLEDVQKHHWIIENYPDASAKTQD